jgi:two-component system, NarL family, response regulator NreC
MASRLHIVPSSGPGSVSSTIRVVLADEHAAMRRSLRSVLESAPGVEVIAEAEDSAAAAKYVHANQPDVLVLGFSMRERSGVEAVRELRNAAPDTKVVVVTMHENATLAEQALRAGAAGFVLKDTADDELVEAVRHAAQGEQYLSPRVARLSALRSEDAARRALTSREVELVRLIALGHRASRSRIG